MNKENLITYVQIGVIILVVLGVFVYIGSLSVGTVMGIDALSGRPIIIFQ